MSRTFFISVVLICMLLAGCASTPNQAGSQNSSVEPETGKARITISRNTDFLYIAAVTRVHVNGSWVAGLWRGESYTGNFIPGKTTITVDAPSSPGHYTLTVVTKPNTDYLFEVGPRDDGLASSMLFGPVGMAIEAKASEQAGSFQVVPKSSEKITTKSQK
jgi:hypothetical protein